jgi:hypothetical protein
VSRQKLELSATMLKRLRILVVLASAKCSSPPDDAREMLSQRGIPFTQKAFAWHAECQHGGRGDDGGGLCSARQTVARA